MEKVDFSSVAKSYARTRNDIPYTFFESLFLRNISFEDKRVADLGCGSGALTRKLRFRKANVVGIEPNDELRAEAKTINEKEFLDIPYVNATAEKTGLDSGRYHFVTVMRAWHWFNREKSIQEIKRILKENGTLIVADSGFISTHSVAKLTFEFLNPYVDGGIKPAGSKADSNHLLNGFPVEWFKEWQTSGFDLKDFYKLDYTVGFSNEEWIERVESLSWLAGMEQGKRKKALSTLLETLESQYGKDANHEMKHYCSVCILKLTKKD